MHTIVVSDLHLTEATEVEPDRPLWMAYKRREHFIDHDFSRMLAEVERLAGEPVELVLNGDIFDFDAVGQLPEKPEGHVNWLARLRGLASEEWMSRFKMERIIADHPLWFSALGAFIARGNRAVFVIGNHDMELHWPAVQALVARALGFEDWGIEALPERASLAEPTAGAEHLPLVFCNWFYLSGGDTYISHGHQYDPNCVSKDPIDPLIRVHGRPRVRIPFGDLAGRYMLNGMGYFNPNATDNYIMSGWQYACFFFKYMVRTQPLLVWTWFWSAVVTLVVTLRDHLHSSMKDPLLVEQKVSSIAVRSNATPAMVRQLDALHVPSSCTQPFAVLRELWLDRGLLLLGLLFLAWQVVLHINIALPISPLWFFVPLALMIPPYVIYASRVKSTVFAEPLLTEERATLIARITGARNVVFGHTHKVEQLRIGPVRYVNGGFWSPAFAEPECKNRIGTQTFAWVRPDATGEGRQATLFEWPPGAGQARPFFVAEPEPPPLRWAGGPRRRRRRRLQTTAAAALVSPTRR